MKKKKLMTIERLKREYWDTRSLTQIHTWLERGMSLYVQGKLPKKIDLSDNVSRPGKRRKGNVKYSTLLRHLGIYLEEREEKERREQRTA